MSYLNEIDDPRKPSNGTWHDFRAILVILIAAVLLASTGRNVSMTLRHRAS